MVIRALIVSLGLSCSGAVWSFPCYYTLVKDSCWTKYNVSVDVIDPATTKKLLTATVPAGKSWIRDTFDCHPAQSLVYIAQFSPVFWKSDEGKKYQGLRNWFLPGEINPGDTAWTITICYPKDFAQVPFPPEADGNCKCDLSAIPPVEPK
ncbi:hypothetical protein [Legionella maioricensis]|uniref:Periplasmic protein n=1 Tax=Legionella maioricensis TaxID=2896528 RepID=A0A9X2I9M0_9GAMM|nr:hypothetical protein [Legionella maioricensis]MCL9683419.1 hypothetical protein [Legionella maioricensis]MCL9688590.1 hypothetical protein [Legionella maioricensis]